MKKILTLNILIGLLCLINVTGYTQFSPTITGPTSVNGGSTYSYTYSGLKPISYEWTTTNGTVTSHTSSTANVKWNTGVTSGTLSYGYNGNVFITYTVIITTPAPSTPSTPTISSNTCGNKALTRGTPPSGVTWYWQGTNSSGTSTLKSTAIYTVSSSGNYYIRARNNSGGLWSTGSRKVSVVVKPRPSTPLTPSISSNTCGNKVLTRGTPPANVTWYWQGTNSNGSSTSNSSSTYTAGSSGSYYLRAKHSSGCWSTSSKKVILLVKPTPSVPLKPTTSTNTCGNKTLTRGTPPLGVTWYWQGTNTNGTSTANSSTTYTCSSTGYYHLKARNNSTGCWSTSKKVYVTVNPNPTPPSATSISSNACGNKTITRSNPPSGITWYWQGTNIQGTSTSNSSANYTVSSAGTYFLRARNNVSGCWSTFSRATTINEIITPPIPPRVPAVDRCGNGVVSMTASAITLPGAEKSFHWYATAISTSALYTGKTYTPSVSSATTTYYVSHDNGFCESTRTPVTVTVNPLPATPVVLDIARCGSGLANIIVSQPSDIYQWYTSSTGGSQLTVGGSYIWGTVTALTGTGNSTITVNVNASTNIYVSRISSDGCPSPRTSVAVSVNPLPSTPMAPSVTPTCELTKLTTITTPPVVTWYWQGTNSNGTDDSPGAASLSYAVTSPGTYYLRAQNNLTGCWSATSRAISVTEIATPPTPPRVSAVDRCGNGVVSMTAFTILVPGTEISHHWYATATSTSVLYTGKTYTTSVSSPTTTYYVSNDNGICESTRTPVTVTVNPLPAAPVVLDIVRCGSGLANIIVSQPSDIYQWYTSSTGGSQLTVGGSYIWGTVTALTGTGNSTITVNVNASTNIYVSRISSDGCPSPRTSVAVSVNPLPSTPMAPSVTPTCELTKLTTITTPPVVTWYWQGTNSNGTDDSPGAASLSYAVTSPGTYYLRAQNNLTGCWSATSRAISVTEIATPPIPPVVLLEEERCGSGVVSMRALTISEDPPEESFTYRWYASNSPADTNVLHLGDVYEPSIPFTTTYYVSRHDGICESTRTAITAVVHSLPPTTTVTNDEFTFCNSDTQKTITISSPTGNQFNWYNASGQPLATFTRTHTLSGYAAGNHILRVREVNILRCESLAEATLSINILAVCDDDFHWATSASFGLDENGDEIILSQSKSYFDVFGKALQSQGKSMQHNAVFASQPVYDHNGKATLSTLAAPINDSDFKYDPNFITNDAGQAYSASDFDNPNTTSGVLGEINNPKPVGNSELGTLGWYYSSNNDIEPMTPVTDYPYARSWTEEHPDPKESKSAGPGDAYRMGAGHNSLSTKQVITSTDLDHYYSLRHHFTDVTTAIEENKGYKNISYAEGKQSIVYTDAEGKTVMTAVEADELINVAFPGSEFTIPEQAGATTLTINVSTLGLFPTPPGESIQEREVAIINMDDDALSQYITVTIPDQQLFIDIDVTVVPSRYRVTGGIVQSAPAMKLNYSYTYYNDMGQVVATVAPRGVNINSTAYPQFVTTYTYDHRGLLMETTSMDEGTSKYLYSTDGKIRFSQNSQQDTEGAKGWFSYTDYDYLGRLVESGQYEGAWDDLSPIEFGLSEMMGLLDNIGNNTWTDTEKTGVTKIFYDMQSVDFVADGDHPQQNWLYGQVAKTSNDQTTSWYSYDEFGRLQWMKQDIVGLGIKTVDYTYDFVGNVLEVAYQKGQADAFYHHYVYDLDQRLTTVYTSTDGVTQTLQAGYEYYYHGPLKRVELGDQLQGIDYVYTITGGLKSINHADKSFDPGQDGQAGVNSTFGEDVFGMTLNYYDGDYTGAGYSAGSQTVTGHNDYYNGAIKAQSWFSPMDDGTPRIYAYQYDHTNQLAQASWGNMTGSAGSYAFAQDATNAHQVNIGGYDLHGNISTLDRKDDTGTSSADYQYNYTTNTNRLANVRDNGTVLTNYTYNAIGQMIAQTEDGQTMYLTYDAYGNMAGAYANSSHSQPIVKFNYDDKGMRVSKETYDESYNLALTTWYVRDAAGNMLTTYTDDGSGLSIAEVPVYGASRIGVYKPAVATMFYEVGDHLGNVRAVIGQPYDVVSIATMETTSEIGFSNIAETQWTFGSANKTVGGNKVAALNQSKPIGPAFMTSVSPGDVVDIHTWAYYEAGSGYNGQLALNTIISALSGAYGGVNGGGEQAQTTYDAFDNALTTFGSGRGGSDTSPNAHLNYILFNRDMLPIQYGFIPVTSAAKNNPDKEKVELAPLNIAIEGILYVYVSNTSASNNMVYFDDLTITHHTSPVVFGNDYYPFGLPMDNRQVTREDYRYGYQGQYAEKDEETGYNAFQLRQYDARFGRWMSTDPYGQFNSPYVGMGNVPNMSVDPDGGWNQLLTIGAMATAGGIIGGLASDDSAKGAAIGFGLGALAGYGATQVNWGSVGNKIKSLGGVKFPAFKPVDVSKAISYMNGAVSGLRAARQVWDNPSWGRSRVLQLPTQLDDVVINPRYIDVAGDFENAPYLLGGMSMQGMDCSGLVNCATGQTERVWYTGSPQGPPGNWEEVFPSTTDADSFIGGLERGDLFLWDGHTAFYEGGANGNTLFHAHGSTGTLTGATNDLRWYLSPDGLGYPRVFRQLMGIHR